jgi:hypothetical protein
MINLFLDDIRIPKMSHNSEKGLGSSFSDKEKWIIVRDFFDFKTIIDNKFDDINIISFDHDLACYDEDGQELTGKTAADYLIQYCLDNDKKFPNWYVHSDNTSGKSNIISVILNYLKVIEGYDTSKFRYFNNGIINEIAV